MSQYISHYNTDNKTSHLLESHLNNVANKSKFFSKNTNNKELSEIAYVVGLLHDLGKYSSEWQNYLKINSGYYNDHSNEPDDTSKHEGKINHSAAGAILLDNLNILNKAKVVLQYCISGHHSGLQDSQSLLKRLVNDKEIILYNKSIENISQSFKDTYINLIKQLEFNSFSKLNDENYHHYIRFIFSTLIDADRLDAELFFNPNKFETRNNFNSINELKIKLDDYYNSLQSSNTDLNIIRNIILSDCNKGAKLEPGFFSLNVPTGGGKTLSGLSFALNHCLNYNKERVIYTIPYTSIIEQTGDVFRNVFGNLSENVIEHHSNLSEDKKSFKSKLASENWDAPIIITTNVQFFESLFSNKPSKTRKIHNISNSVIILDEIQMLPVEFLKPILNCLKFLVEQLNCTVVLCSATQPFIYGKIGSEPYWFDGLDKNKTRELMVSQKPDSLNINLKRVNITYDLNKKSEDDLINLLLKQNKFLCIVDNKDLCKDIYLKLNKNNDKNTYCLSNNMCGEHKSFLIKEIKTKLKNNENVKLISTQLVEAGVDIDFPVVYKKISGIDSIIQAAGRCNREGKLKNIDNTSKMGEVIIFDIDSKSDFIFTKQKKASNYVISLFSKKENYKLNNLHPEIFDQYFQFYYKNIDNFDKADISNKLEKTQKFKFEFKSAADSFHMIQDEDTESVVVRYKNINLINELSSNIDKQIVRKLQRYTINISKSNFNFLIKKSEIETINDVFVLSEKYYSEQLGFNIQRD